MPPTTPFHRNPRLYLWYTSFFNAFFWMPVFFLYLAEQVSVEEVLLLEAIYYATVVLIEVPSGYFSDRVGRRPTLIISSIALLVAYGLFFIGGAFAVLATAQAALAVGIAFNSGTDVSFHHDALAAVGQEDQFAAREALASRNAFLASALAALVGGLVASWQLRLAYGCSLIAALGGLIIAIAFVEPPGAPHPTELGPGFTRQLRSCAALLRQPTLAWLFCFAVVMTVLNHIPYEFYQPYLHLIGLDLIGSATATPLAAGVVTAGTMLIASAVAARSVRIRDRLGIGATLLASGMIQVVVIAVMGAVLHPLVVVLILARSIPRALMTAPLNAAIAPRVARGQRATYLSLQSLVGRLSFSGSLVILSTMAGADTEIQWAPISRMLIISAGGGIVVMVVLAVTVAALSQPRDQAQSRPPD